MSLVERGSVSIGETDWQACYYHECAEVRTKVYTGPGTSRDGVIKTGWELRQKVSKLSGFFFFLMLDQFAWWQDGHTRLF